MQGLIDQTFDIIKCYRTGEEGAMSKQIISTWINQFDPKDREFILTELNHILKQRYITRDVFKEYIKTTFFKDVLGVMEKEHGIKDVKEVFVKSYFINQQPEGKSQKVLLQIFEEVLTEELGLKLSDCGENPICFIYLDDILCTGDTVFKGLKSWLGKKELDPDKTNQIILEEKELPLFNVFYTIHTLNMDKVYSRLHYTLKHKLKLCHFWQDDHHIDNNFENQAKSKLQFIFPQEDLTNELVVTCKKEIEEKIDQYCQEKNYTIPKSHFYRNVESPQEETLYSSAENRKRFEMVILTKSIQIYNAAQSPSLRMRPLGLGLYTEKSFGFGTMIFSWRNVPFNTPLVFWYEHNGWAPLFKRKWSSYQKSFEDILKNLFK